MTPQPSPDTGDTRRIYILAPTRVATEAHLPEVRALHPELPPGAFRQLPAAAGPNSVLGVVLKPGDHVYRCGGQYGNGSREAAFWAAWEMVLRSSDGGETAEWHTLP